MDGVSTPGTRTIAGLLAVLVIAAGLTVATALPAQAARTYSVSATPRTVTVEVGRFAFLAGKVSPRAAGQRVVLQRFVSGVWRNIKTARLSSSSTYTVSFRSTVRATWKVRVRKPGISGIRAGVSPTRTIAFVPKFTVALNQPGTGWTSRATGVTGTVRPIAAGARVRVERRLSNGAWTYLGTATLSTAGTFTFPATINDPGTQTLRAVMPTVTRKGVTGISSARSFTLVTAERYAAGNSHMCRVLASSALSCWGSNLWGEIGVGDLVIDGVAPRTLPGTGWVSVATGATHTCATKTDLTAWCWGRNQDGALGTGSFSTLSDVPAQVAGQWRSVTAGRHHTCGIRADLSAACWGNGEDHRLGTGTVDYRPGPTALVPAGTNTWVALAGGERGTCGIQTDGSGWCWGNNADGQGGADSSAATLDVPTVLAPTSAAPWASLALGAKHACGRKADTTLWCWGDHASGALGIGGNAAESRVPAQVAGSWSDVAAADTVSCGVRTAGTLFCWGQNDYGGLTAGADVSSSTPSQVTTLTTWRSVRLGSNFACGVLSSGTTPCWGENDLAQHGDGADGLALEPEQSGTATDWSQVEGGTSHLCGIRASGSLWCWGRNAEGQLGIGSTQQRSTPMQVLPGTTWKSVSAGAASTCAIRTDDTLWCWGANASGQLGIGSTAPSLAPTQVTGGPGTWMNVSAGRDHTCGVAIDESLWCWGESDSGRLGALGVTEDALSPIETEFNDSLSWSAVTTGATHSCGLDFNGQRFCWGDSFHGQTGTGSSGQGEFEPVPQNNASDSAFDYLDIAAGDRHTCAVRNGNTLWCWGDNPFSQLGSGNTTDQNLPSQVGVATDWAGVTTGSEHTCGVRNTGSLWCWGFNNFGQAGLGDTDGNHTTPEQVGSATDWSQIASGGRTTCALRGAGTLWCWGLNDEGSLGDGSILQRPTAVGVNQPR